MQVELVDFISVPTRDTARAVAWYRDVLGLPASAVTEGEIEAPNVTFSFWEPESEGLPFVAHPDPAPTLRAANETSVTRRRALSCAFHAQC